MTKQWSMALTKLKAKHLVLILVVVISAIVPQFMSTYYIHIGILVLLFMYWSSAWNIVGGISGQFSFMHPLFIAAGAYTSTVLYLNIGLSPWLGMLIGAVIAIVIGIAIGYISYRAKLPYLTFALITLGFTFIGLYICESWELVGGYRGLGIPRNLGFVNFQFQSKEAYYYIILIMTIVLIFVCWLILRSKLGYYFRALRDNPNIAEALGINLMRYRLTAIAISAFFTSLGGTFYAQLTHYVNPGSAVSIVAVIEMILFSAVGGMGTLWGPVIGAGILKPIGEVLRASLPTQFAGLHRLMYGVIVIVIIYFLPHGILGWFTELYQKRRRATSNANPD